MKKRLVSLLLMLAMLISMMPSMAFAGQTDAAGSEGTVYISYAHDGKYAEGGSDTGYMAYVPINIADIAADSEINCENDYSYDADGDGINEITVLMAFQYALKTYGQGLDDLQIEGSAGSVYMKEGAWHLNDGVPWDENLNYYVNGAFPQSSDGWGATCDQLPLHDGDYIDVSHYSDWNFLFDAEAGYQFFASAVGTAEDITHAFSGTAGEPIEAYLVRAGNDMNTGGDSAYSAYQNTVHYGTSLYDEKGSWESDESGAVEMTFAEPGEYWIWADGKEGDSGTIVNSPAIAKVTVQAKSEETETALDLAVKALEDEDPLEPVQWNSGYTAKQDENVITMAQAIVDEAAEGITVQSANPVDQDVISSDGTIIYGSTEDETDVTFTLSDGEGTKEVTLTVIVPEEKIRRQDVFDGVMNTDYLTEQILNKNTSLSEITGNLSNMATPSTFEMYVQVSWNIPDEYSDYLTNRGTVTRPAHGEEDVSFDLTATGSWYKWMEVYMPSGYVGPNPKNASVVLPVTIKAITDEEFAEAKAAVDEALENFTAEKITYFLNTSEVADLDAVTGDLMLPSVDGFVSNGSDTVWTSADESVVKAPLYKTGRAAVTRPDVGEDPASTVITLTLSRNGYSASKNFNVTVLPLTQEELDAEKEIMEQVAQDLSFDTIKKNNTRPDAVLEGLQMVYRGYLDSETGEVSYKTSNSGNDGVKIEWATSNASVVKTYGTVTRPNADTPVTMTATISSIKYPNDVEPIKVEIPITVLGKNAKTARVDFTSQMSGAFLHAPVFGYDILSTASDEYGFEDGVPSDSGVSTLDVLLTAHEMVYGDDFTVDTASQYIKMSAMNATKIFGAEGMTPGFFVNHAQPNDGNEPSGGWYTGTLIGNTPVSDGDLVEFAFWEDEYYGDTYNWFLDMADKYSREFTVHEGEDLDLTLRGIYAMQMAQFNGEEEVVAAGDDKGAYYVEDAQIYTVDPETGALEAMLDAVTDEDGLVTLNFDEPGEYYITAYGNSDCMFTQIMSLTKVTVTAHQLVKTEAKAPNCANNGNIEYWYCEACGQYFGDAEGTAVIDKEDTVLPADPEAHVWDEGTVTIHAGFDREGVTTYTCTICEATKEETIPAYGFTVKVDGKEITDIEIVEDGYDASYEDWTTGEKVESMIPLAIVKVPEGTTLAEVTLNDHVSEYNTYYYTREPDSTGYTQFIDYGIGEMEEFMGMEMPIAKAGTAYEAKVNEDQVIRVQTKYDSNWVSNNLYAIAFDFEAAGTDENEIIRLYGPNRYDTAIQAAAHLKKKTGSDSFSNVIIASGNDFPDALSATYLAAVKNAPILLVGNPDSINKVSAYVNESLAEGGTIYIIGGTGAVSADLDGMLQGTVKRLYGPNRYATNIEVLKEAGVDGKELLVASGNDFADALSASAAGRPILLVGNALTPDQEKYLEENKDKLGDKVYVIGGTGAVKDAVKTAVEGKLGITAERLAGSNRYETSKMVANTFFPDGAETLVIASGKDFPDGLSGGPISLAYGAPLVLVNDGVTAYAEEIFEKGSHTLVVMGGTGAVSRKIAETIAAPATEE